MRFFETENNSLIFRENGETVQITPWGKDSFRVRANFLGEISEGPGALLEPVDMDTEPAFVIEDECASITNGKITAFCHVDRWGNRLQITSFRAGPQEFPGQRAILCIQPGLRIFVE